LLKKGDITMETKEKENVKEYVEFIPAADIIESEHAIHLKLDMPGANKENITIDIEDHTLTISSDTGIIYNDKSLRYQRAFSISNEIDLTKISATSENGILNLELPKAESAKPFKVKVAG
jgi:HSP20 family molecular chaperone IbpA